MGNVQPTLPDAPKAKKDCGAKQILIAVVAVVVAAVVTYFTAGALGGVAMSWAGAMVAGVAGAAGAAAGAVASQLTGVALGTQKLSDFSWNAVRDAGIGGFVSGVVTAGIGNIGWLKTLDGAEQGMRMLMAFSRAAISTTISSGVMSAANKGTFSWRDSIVSGVSAGLSASDAGSKITGQQLANPRNIGYHLTSGLLEESVQSLVYSDDFDFAAVARNTVNSYVKQSVENGLQQVDHDRQIDDLMQRTGIEERGEAEAMMTEYTDRHNGGAQAAEYYAQKNANKYGGIVFNPDMDNLDAAQKYVSDYLPNAGQMSDSVGVDIWADDGLMGDVDYESFLVGDEIMDVNEYMDTMVDPDSYEKIGLIEDARNRTGLTGFDDHGKRVPADDIALKNAYTKYNEAHFGKSFDVDKSFGKGTRNDKAWDRGMAIWNAEDQTVDLEIYVNYQNDDFKEDLTTFDRLKGLHKNAINRFLSRKVDIGGSPFAVTTNVVEHENGIPVELKIGNGRSFNTAIDMFGSSVYEDPKWVTTIDPRFGLSPREMDFSNNAAHELLHSVVMESKGLTASYNHHGTSTSPLLHWIDGSTTLPTAPNTPANVEFDIFKYYPKNSSANDIQNRYLNGKASENDIKALIYKLQR